MKKKKKSKTELTFSGLGPKEVPQLGGSSWKVMRNSEKDKAKTFKKEENKFHFQTIKSTKPFNVTKIMAYYAACTMS